MNYHYQPIAVKLECRICGWMSWSYKNALAIAKKHAQKYKHNVTGELTISFGYDYTDEEQTAREKETNHVAG